MKKNIYGNIEDMVVDVVVVTASGTLNQGTSAPRVSCGPSLQQLMLGSEGTLGIITQVLLRVKILPEVSCNPQCSFRCLFDSGKSVAYSWRAYFFLLAAHDLRLFSLSNIRSWGAFLKAHCFGQDAAGQRSSYG